MAKNMNNDSVNLSDYSGKMPTKRRSRRVKGRAIINTLASLVLIFSIAMISFTFILDMRPVAGAPVNDGYEEVPTSEHAGVSYILVTGLDVSASLTDIILIACIDHEKNTMNLLQIPRDIFIGADITYGKINGVYGEPRPGEKGIDALRRRINSTLGIPIDHYVTFTLAGFRKIIDAVGGVPLNITQKDGLNVENHVEGTWIHLDPGMNTLDGIKAEGFMRKRYGYERDGYGLGDISRVQQQRIFYAAVAEKMKDINLVQMLKIATTCYDDITTSMSVNEMLSYAKEVKEIEMEQMHIETIPGQFATYNDISYYSVHKQEYVNLYNEYFNPYGNQLMASNIGIQELHVILGEYEEESVVTNGGTLQDIMKAVEAKGKENHGD